MKANFNSNAKFRRKEDVTHVELAVLIAGGGVCDRSENARCSVRKFLSIRGLCRGRCRIPSTHGTSLNHNQKYSMTHATEATTMAVKVQQQDKGTSEALPPFTRGSSGLHSLSFFSSSSPKNCTRANCASSKCAARLNRVLELILFVLPLSPLVPLSTAFSDVS